MKFGIILEPCAQWTWPYEKVSWVTTSFQFLFIPWIFLKRVYRHISMKNVNTPPLLQWELGGSLSFTQSLTEKKKTHEDYRAEKDGN